MFRIWMTGIPFSAMQKIVPRAELVTEGIRSRLRGPLAFLMKTTDILQFKDPTKAMIACELRYTTENFFSDLQNDEDRYRLDVYTPHNLYVRVFVQFVA